MAIPVINLADLAIPAEDLTRIEAALLVLERKLKPRLVTLTVQVPMEAGRSPGFC